MPIVTLDSLARQVADFACAIDARVDGLESLALPPELAGSRDWERIGFIASLPALPLLLNLAEPFLSRGAVGLFHKGQDVDAELTEATKYWKMTFIKHASQYDSRGVILEINEATRV